MLQPITYTPTQAADILQLSKNTIYDLINKGEIIAKKIGRVYRIPPQSLSFALIGLDYDLFAAEQEDKQNLPKIQKALKKVRQNL